MNLGKKDVKRSLSRGKDNEEASPLHSKTPSISSRSTGSNTVKRPPFRLYLSSNSSTHRTSSTHSTSSVTPQRSQPTSTKTLNLKQKPDKTTTIQKPNSTLRSRYVASRSVSMSIDSQAKIRPSTAPAVANNGSKPLLNSTHTSKPTIQTINHRASSLVASKARVNDSHVKFSGVMSSSSIQGLAVVVSRSVIMPNDSATIRPGTVPAVTNNRSKPSLNTTYTSQPTIQTKNRRASSLVAGTSRVHNSCVKSEALSNQGLAMVASRSVKRSTDLPASTKLDLRPSFINIKSGSSNSPPDIRQNRSSSTSERRVSNVVSKPMVNNSRMKSESKVAGKSAVTESEPMPFIRSTDLAPTTKPILSVLNGRSKKLPYSSTNTNAGNRRIQHREHFLTRQRQASNVVGGTHGANNSGVKLSEFTDMSSATSSLQCRGQLAARKRKPSKIPQPVMKLTASSKASGQIGQMSISKWQPNDTLASDMKVALTSEYSSAEAEESEVKGNEEAEGKDLLTRSRSRCASQKSSVSSCGSWASSHSFLSSGSSSFGSAVSCMSSCGLLRHKIIRPSSANYQEAIEASAEQKEICADDIDDIIITKGASTNPDLLEGVESLPNTGGNDENPKEWMPFFMYPEANCYNFGCNWMPSGRSFDDEDEYDEYVQYLNIDSSPIYQPDKSGVIIEEVTDSQAQVWLAEDQKEISDDEVPPRGAESTEQIFPTEMVDDLLRDFQNRTTLSSIESEMDVTFNQNVILCEVPPRDAESTEEILPAEMEDGLLSDFQDRMMTLSPVQSEMDTFSTQEVPPREAELIEPLLPAEMADDLLSDFQSRRTLSPIESETDDSSTHEVPPQGAESTEQIFPAEMLDDLSNSQNRRTLSPIESQTDDSSTEEAQQLLKLESIQDKMKCEKSLMDEKIDLLANNSDVDICAGKHHPTKLDEEMQSANTSSGFSIGNNLLEKCSRVLSAIPESCDKLVDELQGRLNNLVGQLLDPSWAHLTLQSAEVMKALASFSSDGLNGKDEHCAHKETIRVCVSHIYQDMMALVEKNQYLWQKESETDKKLSDLVESHAYLFDAIDKYENIVNNMNLLLEKERSKRIEAEEREAIVSQLECQLNEQTRRTKSLEAIFFERTCELRKFIKEDKNLKRRFLSKELENVFKIKELEHNLQEATLKHEEVQKALSERLEESKRHQDKICRDMHTRNGLLQEEIKRFESSEIKQKNRLAELLERHQHHEKDMKATMRELQARLEKTETLLAEEKSHSQLLQTDLNAKAEMLEELTHDSEQAELLQENLNKAEKLVELENVSLQVEQTKLVPISKDVKQELDSPYEAGNISESNSVCKICKANEHDLWLELEATKVILKNTKLKYAQVISERDTSLQMLKETNCKAEQKNEIIAHLEHENGSLREELGNSVTNCEKEHKEKKRLQRVVFDLTESQEKKQPKSAPLNNCQLEEKLQLSESYVKELTHHLEVLEDTLASRDQETEKKDAIIHEQANALRTRDKLMEVLRRRINSTNSSIKSAYSTANTYDSDADTWDTRSSGMSMTSNKPSALSHDKQLVRKNTQNPSNMRSVRPTSKEALFFQKKVSELQERLHNAQRDLRTNL